MKTLIHEMCLSNRNKYVITCETWLYVFFIIVIQKADALWDFDIAENNPLRCMIKTKHEMSIRVNYFS